VQLSIRNVRPATITAGAVDTIVRHARTTAPEECCGILLGAADAIDEARPARNVADRPTARFVVDPRDHFQAIRDARERGVAIVGFYHSHPRSAAVPSETDRAEATSPGHLFLIVGLASADPEIRLYRFTDGNFLEVPLVRVG
jgi:proteasome lid subunit RPN8/RPN11